MIDITACEVLTDRGLTLENRKPGKRELTLLSAEAWANACRNLCAVIPWHLRRANLLVEGIDLAATIGQTLAVGEVRVTIHMESKPCGLMDRQYEGLRAALEPECRGGVAGQILIGGTIRIGDPVAAL